MKRRSSGPRRPASASRPCQGSTGGCGKDAEGPCIRPLILDRMRHRTGGTSSRTMLFSDTPLPSITRATVRTSYQGIAARSPSSGPTSFV